MKNPLLSNNYKTKINSCNNVRQAMQAFFIISVYTNEYYLYFILYLFVASRTWTTSEQIDKIIANTPKTNPNHLIYAEVVVKA